jgi:hypothetical protein
MARRHRIGPSARLLDGPGAHPSAAGHPPRRLLRVPRGLRRPGVRAPPLVDPPRRHLKAPAAAPLAGRAFLPLALYYTRADATTSKSAQIHSTISSVSNPQRNKNQ